MGKSPAKWIKTVLFGKKSSRSNSTKKGVNEKRTTGEKGPVLAEPSPVISDPVLVTAHSTGATVPSGAKEEIQISNAQMDAPVTNQEVTTQRVTELNPSQNQEKLLEEQAAVKAQAAFRGYLARRAFKALKGIIRLQALIRGHLVRRQAVSMLRAIYYIVRFQALVRGTSVRKSGTSFGTTTSILGTKKYSDVWKEYSFANAFARKLLSYGTKVEPLHFQYESQDPNSVFSWLTRWTKAKTWKPIPQLKKPVSDVKSQSRKSSYAMETESAKLKRKAHKNPSINTEPSQTGQSRASRKFSAESAQENSPLTELEKVKRNLRKVTSLVPDSSNNEVESERNSLSAREIVVPVPNNTELSNGNLPEKARKSGTGTGPIVVPEMKPKREKDTTVAPEIETKREKDVQFTEKNEETLKPEGQNGQFTELNPPVEEISLERNREEMDIMIPKEEEQLLSNEISNKTTSKRRSSLSTPPSTKIEYSENKEIIQNNNNNNNTPPAVPSYMAMTASAKTKLKGQNSPRFGSDNGSNGSTRRHSLPTGTNSGGKLSSQSPRTQRPIPVKGGVKSDKSMHSSRDGTDKPIVEWRR